MTQAHGDGTGPDVVNRIAVTGSGGTLTTTSLTPVGSHATTGKTIFNLTESFRTDDGTPSGVLQNYDAAWDQYNSTTEAYQVYFQNFNADNSVLAPTPVLTTLNLSVADRSQLPAWELRSGLADTCLPRYPD